MCAEGVSDKVGVEALIAFSSLFCARPTFPGLNTWNCVSQAPEKCEVGWNPIPILDMVKVWGVRKMNQQKEVVTPDLRPAAEVRND